MSKADWYLKEGLGVEVESLDPGIHKVVRLNFTPKGVGHAGDAYYLQTMENCCVGCGASEDVIRYSIVPPVFRSLLPLRFKEHSSHDIVLLCPACFAPASDAAQRLRRRHLGECGLEEPHAARYRVDQERMKARSAAFALRCPRLPDEVRAAKERVVREFLGRCPEDPDPLSQEDIEQVSGMETRNLVEGYVSPEVACAARLGLLERAGADVEGGDPAALERRCFEFVVGWRRCFLESVQPRHLPKAWDLHRSLRKHDDLFGPGVVAGGTGALPVPPDAVHQKRGRE
ncbi:unnamed protein product [Prorocentrum cordatum]|uniref:Uncharacterized protein n=1 Tax=Prorocentrum cordatum TaxID=2364126 RepID=A0ABN9VAK4_9DINO|nr:unnamed protein product [Polarella glacialis]